MKDKGAWVTQSVKRLPLAWVMIPGSWDQAPCWRVGLPAQWGICFSLYSPSPLMLTLKWINKIFKKYIKKMKDRTRVVARDMK